MSSEVRETEGVVRFSPEHATVYFSGALRLAIERKRWDVLLRFIPDARRDGIDVEKIKAAWEGAEKPEVDALAKDLEGKAKVVKIDIDKSPFLAKQFRVQSVPMFFVFAQGRIVDGQAGALTKKALRTMVEPHLPRQAGALKAEMVVI